MGKEHSDSEPERTWRSATRTLATLLAAANAVLLVVQATLAQSPFDIWLPGWTYVAVNAGVVAVAGISNILRIVTSITLSPDEPEGPASADSPKDAVR